MSAADGAGVGSEDLPQSSARLCRRGEQLERRRERGELLLSLRREDHLQVWRGHLRQPWRHRDGHFHSDGAALAERRVQRGVERVLVAARRVEVDGRLDEVEQLLEVGVRLPRHCSQEAQRR